MIYVFLADGFEETEALAPVDILRRSGAEVKTVGVTGKTVTSSHKVPVIADITVDDIVLDDNLELIVLPGGIPGTPNLESNDKVNEAIDFCVANNKYIGAICAAPSILGHKNLLNGKTAICFPGFEKELKGAVLSNDGVAVDGNIITAKGAGRSLDFGLKLAELVVSKEKSESVGASMQCR